LRLYPLAVVLSPPALTHLRQLEAESIHIIREVAAEFQKPVMLYSIGKDSSCMLHLAKKAFHPAPLPFPLLHVDTTWKFREMYRVRDEVAKMDGVRLLVHVNREGLAQGANPFDWPSQKYTTVMKTHGLLQALKMHGFDAAFGGARRDEEKSRAKERIFSFRNAQHAWDPKNQRPEMWKIYNTRVSPGESIRVFPLSNWTELDIWQYILQENIPIVPLYFAKERPIVERDGMLILKDDDRMELRDGEIGRRGAGRHVARILFVAGCIRDDELALRRGKEAIGDVDRDTLLALGLQSVDQQGEVDIAARGAVLRRVTLQRRELVLEDQLRVVEQPTD